MSPPPTFQIALFLMTTDTRIKAATTWAGRLYIMRGPDIQVKPHCVFMYACMCVCLCVRCMSSGNRLETAAPIRDRFLFRAQTDTVHNPHCETNSPEPLPGSHLTRTHTQTYTHTSECMRHMTDHTSWLQVVQSKMSQSNITPQT